MHNRIPQTKMMEMIITIIRIVTYSLVVLRVPQSPIQGKPILLSPSSYTRKIIQIEYYLPFCFYIHLSHSETMKVMTKLIILPTLPTEQLTSFLFLFIKKVINITLRKHSWHKCYFNYRYKNRETSFVTIKFSFYQSVACKY